MTIGRLTTYAAALCGVVSLLTLPAPAQLRIVDYNTTGGPNAGLSTVLEAIGNYVVNGFAKPIDVLALQEQTSSATTTQQIVNLLNSIYGAGTYARATLDGGTTGGGGGRPGMIYNSSTIQLIGQSTVGTVDTSGQARQGLRYQLRPVGYGPSADFYLYSNHYKAGDSEPDRDRRRVEALALRMDLDGLGEGTHAILAGDYNVYDSFESSYQTLLSPGPGQAFDPINRAGNWHDDPVLFRDVHTQSTVEGTGPSAGGMSDRFDFQLVTREFLEGEGMDYIPGSYRAFGNNGTHMLNKSISTGTGADPDVLSALITASDHLPVVADYQLPAMLEVTTAAIPATLVVGQVFQLAVTVSNGANVLVPGGADELDYNGVSFGDIVGMFSDNDPALGTGNTHLLSLDTASLGIKSGLVRVTSTSQGVAGGLVEIPISFEVISGLPGDYNGNGNVDAADYVAWRNNLDQSVTLPNDASPGTVSQADYDVWRRNFGAGSGDSFVSAVPEPAASLLIIGSVSFLAIRRYGRLSHSLCQCFQNSSSLSNFVCASSIFSGPWSK
jgi:hypothetical protein